MNKPRNQFGALPDQDRNLILDLCSKHPYEEVVEILSRSRDEGGLEMLTSRSALCRLFTTWHPEPDRPVLAQYATAAHVRHQYDSNAFPAAFRLHPPFRRSFRPRLKDQEKVVDVDG